MQTVESRINETQQKTHHVTMSIERLHTSQQLFVVPQGDEYLRMVPYGLLQHGERSLANLVLLESPQLCLIEFRLWDMYVLTAYLIS